MRLSRILGRAESDPGRRAQLMRPGYLRGLVTGYGLSLVLACGASAVTSSSAREFQGLQVPPALAPQVDAARPAILARWPACTLDGWTLQGQATPFTPPAGTWCGSTACTGPVRGYTNPGHRRIVVWERDPALVAVLAWEGCNACRWETTGELRDVGCGA